MTLIAFAYQYVNKRRVGSDVVYAEQYMVIPATGQVWARQVSTRHPRSRWSLSDALGNEFYDADPSTYLITRRLMQIGHRTDEVFVNEDNVWNLSHDVPLTFEISDDEVPGLRSGVLPRNVILRFQRALEAKKCLVLGKNRWDVEKVIGTLIDQQDRLLVASRDYGDTLVDRVVRITSNASLSILADGGKTVSHRYTPVSARVARREEYRAKIDPASAPAPTPVAEPVASTPAVTTAVSADTIKPGTKLTRPNGQIYIARAVEAGVPDLSDIDLFRRAHARGAHILAFGEPGTGKTAGFEIAFPGLVTMLGTAETEADHFVGSYVVTLGADGKEVLTWEDGPLIRAMESGVPLFVDEIGVIPPNQLTVLFSVMDGRGEIRVTANPARGVVKAKKGFGVIAATNPNAPGVRLSEALLSRFGIKIEIGTNYKAARTLKVNRRMVDAAEHLAKQRSNGEASWAPEMRELLQFRDDEADLGLTFALRNLLNNVPVMERDLVQSHLQERFGDLVPPAQVTGLQVN